MVTRQLSHGSFAERLVQTSDSQLMHYRLSTHREVFDPLKDALLNCAEDHH
jgi:hypothetical protein